MGIAVIYRFRFEAFYISRFLLLGQFDEHYFYCLSVVLVVAVLFLKIRSSLWFLGFLISGN